jgi:hypothetical protein
MDDRGDNVVLPSVQLASLLPGGERSTSEQSEGSWVGGSQPRREFPLTRLARSAHSAASPQWGEAKFCLLNANHWRAANLPKNPRAKMF